MSLFHRKVALASAGIAAVAITAAGGIPAAQAATTTKPIQAAAGWLTTQFVDSSHLPSPHGTHFDSKAGKDYFANYGENADVIFGLAAAKAGRAKLAVALGYLKKNLDAYADLSKKFGGPYDGAVAKVALAVIVASGDPTKVAGHNLMNVLAKGECPAASTTCTPGAAAGIFSSVSESLVLLAEARTGGKYGPTARALEYFASLQCGNGGFTVGVTKCGSGKADIDATSYAIMALTAVGGHNPELHDAVAWLNGRRSTAGYWRTAPMPGAPVVPNVNSTGLAAAALQGAGRSVTKSRSWLRSQQIGSGKPGAGAFRYDKTFTPTTTSATSPSVLATAQALTGLADGGSLATLTAEGSASSVSYFAPTARLSSSHVRPGHHRTVIGHGFAAGEKVTVRLHPGSTVLGTATTDPSGTVSVRCYLTVGTPTGRHTVTVHGHASGLTVTRTISIMPR